MFQAGGPDAAGAGSYGVGSIFTHCPGNNRMKHGMALTNLGNCNDPVFCG